MELIVLAGLVCGVSGMLCGFSPNSTVDDQEKGHIIRGLILAFFAVGLFSVGGMLIRQAAVSIMDVNQAGLGGVVFEAFLLLTLLLGLNSRR